MSEAVHMPYYDLGKAQTYGVQHVLKQQCSIPLAQMCPERRGHALLVAAHCLINLAVLWWRLMYLWGMAGSYC